MKAIKYELKMIHKKEIVLAADSRKMKSDSTFYSFNKSYPGVVRVSG